MRYDCANVADAYCEESKCLKEEIYEVMVLPKCHIIASTEEEVRSGSELQ